VTDHTSSATFFDARKFNIVGETNTASIDFALFPDGNINTVEPQSGRLADYGLGPGIDVVDIVVSNGVLVSNVPNMYMQFALPDTREKIQHLWAEFTVPADNTAANIGATLHINQGNWWTINPSVSGVHWQIYGNVGGQVGVSGAVLGGYPGPPIREVAGRLVGDIRGKVVRIDIIVNQGTSMLYLFQDGVMQNQYRDVNIGAYTSGFGICQFANPTNLLRFGVSADLPVWALDGSRRAGYNGRNGFIADRAIVNGTWKMMQSVNVAYDTGGAVEFSWNPIVNVNGKTEVNVSPVGTEPGNFNQPILTNSAFNNMVSVTLARTGTPGTIENVGIWVRGNTGTGSLVDGQDNGLRWRPSNATTISPNV
jgi:hypothetical protein